ERKSQIALRPGIPFDRLLELRVAAHRRKQTDVTPECREVHEDAALLERRHAVADAFLSCGRRRANYAPDLAQNRPHMCGRSRDVLVDVRCGGHGARKYTS